MALLTKILSQHEPIDPAQVWLKLRHNQTVSLAELQTLEAAINSYLPRHTAQTLKKPVLWGDDLDDARELIKIARKRSS